MKKQLNEIGNNAVFLFLRTYFIILAVILFCCTICFNRAFRIVEDNLIEENEFLMKQGVSRIEAILDEAYRNGIQLNSSDALKHLGYMEEPVQPEYMNAAKAVVSKYAETVFRCKEWEGTVFVHLPKMNRVIFDNASYLMPVFKTIYLKSWGITDEEWTQLSSGNEIIPYICTQNSGDLLYVFPCMAAAENKDRIGTTFIQISRDQLLGRMQYLEKYSSYSFFLVQEGKNLLSEDRLACKEELLEEWMTVPGSYTYGERLVFNVNLDKNSRRNYILVIPQQEALVRLAGLRSFVWVTVLSAMVCGVMLAVFFSVRSGRPINQMIQLLSGYNKKLRVSDLDGLNQTVGKVVQENKKDIAELRKMFFSNLLKAEFVSGTEMKYMAQRAELELKNGTYYAAAIRFFPQIDVESIDGTTVEEVRLLQNLVKERLESLWPLSMWSYKKNTLVTMYVIEANEEEALVKTLEDAVFWLRNEKHADAFWGVGTPCRDLMVFWKSAEEAYAALGNNEREQLVCCYSKLSFHDNTCYFPYTAEDYLANGLRNGESGSVREVLQIIMEENFHRRKIGRKQFLKLNHSICEILALQIRENNGSEERLVQLSSIIAENKEDYEAYFQCLDSICEEICAYVTGQKDKKRQEKMEDILGFIQENFSNSGMGLGMVSDHCKLSEGYLSVMFKEEMQVNFGDYLENLRMEKACEYLLQGELIADVAKKTGYNSAQSFRRAFKRVKNVSPSEYRA